MSKRCDARNGLGSRLERPQRAAPLAGGALLLMALSACGGGGAGGATGTTVSSLGGSTTPTLPPVGSAPFVDSTDAFLFQAGGATADAAALDGVAGGTRLFKGWNPVAGEMLTPGMKVSFFGQAAGCSGALANGPVTELASAPDAGLQAEMALSAPAGGFVRDWQPNGQSGQCDASAQTAQGPSRVLLGADAAGGAVGLRTHADVPGDGAQAFFRPYDAAGQNGTGANAFNTSSFVTFRMDWANAPRHPWAATTQGGAPGVARIYSQQSIGAATTTAPASATLPVQAKQFVSVAFINNACAAQGITADRPCIVKYLIHTAIVQAGVTDWGTVGWWGKARVWFDPVQRGMPIVEAGAAAAGQTLNDTDTGLPVFASAGAAARHGGFSDQAFDLRIGFDQLQNVLRIVTARADGATPDGVTATQLAQMWGPSWNDPAGWSLVTVAVGQEVHNPYAEGVARIGGSFRNVYVGPQS